MRYSLLILFTLIFFETYSQSYYGISEANLSDARIPRKNYSWRSIDYNHYSIHFYQGGEANAQKVGRYLSEEPDNISQTLGFIFFSNYSIFLFNKQEDLDNSNLSTFDFGLVKENAFDREQSRIFVVYDNKDTLAIPRMINQISKNFVHEMFYGGSIRETFQNQFSSKLPDWFILGVSAYSSEIFKPQLESFRLKIGQIDEKILNNIEKEKAERVGVVIWSFISKKYGRNNISNILNLARIIRSEKAAIANTLNIPYSEFLRALNIYLQTGIIEGKEETEVPMEVKEEEKKRVLDLAPGEIDPYHYVFDERNIAKFGSRSKKSEKQKNVLNEEKKGSVTNAQIGKIHAFKNLIYSTENSLDIAYDPVRRFGFKAQIIFKDILNNQFLYLDTYLRPTSPLIKNYDYGVRYENLTNRLDYEVFFKKRSLYFDQLNSDNAYLFRPLNLYNLNDIDKNIQFLLRKVQFSETGGILNYSLRKHVKVTMGSKYIKTKDIDFLSTANNTKTVNYFNISYGLQYNDIKYFSDFIMSGVRILYNHDNYAHKTEGFKNTHFELRAYRKLGRGLMAAGRFDFNKSAGKKPKYSYLGGVEGQINREVYDANIVSSIAAPGSIMDILYYNFPGNLHGFKIGRIYGNSSLLANLELRFVFSEYLPYFAQNSSFLKSFQLVGFLDSGTAWNGDDGPFSKENSLNTASFGSLSNSSFSAVVTNFNNPFLTSGGIGTRSYLLGVNLRVDYGFPFNNSSSSKGIFQFSLSRDF